MADIRHVQVKLDRDLAEWFEQNCPAFSKQDFIEQCFLLLRVAVETGSIPHPNIFPAKAATLAIEALNGPTAIRTERSST